MKKEIFCLMLILALVLTGCITVQVTEEAKEEQPKTNKVLMNVTEQYFEYEDVPYGPMACLDEPYVYDEELIMTHYVAEPNDDGEMDHFMVCEVKVANNEEVAGTWKYSMTFNKKENNYDKPSIQQELEPGETYIFRWRYEEEYGPIACTPNRLEIPIIERCRYPDDAPLKRVKVVKNMTVEKLVDVPVE